MRLTFWEKPRLYEDSSHHRKVSWLELFFDLVFVVVISEIVHILSQNPSGVGNYLYLFIPAWWIWMGASYYHDRFETDGLDQRFFTFLLMIPVAGLAIFAHGIPDGETLGYGMSYTTARFILVIMWLRASVHEKKFRPIGLILVSGFSLSIICFIAFLKAAPAVRHTFWVVALVCDLVTPLLTIKKQQRLPQSQLSKLPERLGLFMLIVMGEMLVAVIRGIARHHHFHFRIVFEGVLGLAIGFAIWWIYFDYIAERSPKKDQKSFFLWSYFHLILAMTVGAVGAAILTILTARHHVPTDGMRYMMTGALALSLVVMALIETILEPKQESRLKFTTINKLVGSGVLVLIGATGHNYHSSHLMLYIVGALLIPILAPAVRKIGMKVD